MNRIFLIGFMGTGKSLYGSKLAKLLGYDFIDLDKLIEDKEDSSISDIFLNAGEDYFRKTESEYLKGINQHNVVVAVGGGTPCFFDNMQVIKENGISVYLKSTPEMLFSRLKSNKDDRPLLSPLNDDELRAYIVNKMNERSKYYEQADITVDALNLTAQKLKDAITQYMPLRSSQG